MRAGHSVKVRMGCSRQPRTRIYFPIMQSEYSVGTLAGFSEIKQFLNFYFPFRENPAKKVWVPEPGKRNPPWSRVSAKIIGTVDLQSNRPEKLRTGRLFFAVQKNWRTGLE